MFRASGRPPGKSKACRGCDVSEVGHPEPHVRHLPPWIPASAGVSAGKEERIVGWARATPIPTTPHKPRTRMVGIAPLNSPYAGLFANFQTPVSGLKTYARFLLESEPEEDSSLLFFDFIDFVCLTSHFEADFAVNLTPSTNSRLDGILITTTTMFPFCADCSFA